MAFDPAQHTFKSAGFQTVVNQAIEFLDDTPVYPLPPSEPFDGSGVYALYYTGRFPYYSTIAVANQSRYLQPIYAGKAVPEGWRTGRIVDQKTRKLHQRLREHARSIKQAENLELRDFCCRFIILIGDETNLISAVESEMFRRYVPIWNAYIDGFGNHDPGKGRYDQAVSEWDALHPGRPWVSRLTGKTPSISNIIAKIPPNLLSSPLP